MLWEYVWILRFQRLIIHTLAFLSYPYFLLEKMSLFHKYCNELIGSTLFNVPFTGEAPGRGGLQIEAEKRNEVKSEKRLRWMIQKGTGIIFMNFLCFCFIRYYPFIISSVALKKITKWHTQINLKERAWILESSFIFISVLYKRLLSLISNLCKGLISRD